MRSAQRSCKPTSLVGCRAAVQKVAVAMMAGNFQPWPREIEIRVHQIDIAAHSHVRKGKLITGKPFAEGTKAAELWPLWAWSGQS